MKAIPPSYETLFPGGPFLDRAQRLILNHESDSHSAWIAQTDAADLLGRPLESYLGASELTTAATFRFAARRETYLLGRLAAKAAAGPYLADSDWTRIELTHGVFGQPLVTSMAAIIKNECPIKYLVRNGIIYCRETGAAAATYQRICIQVNLILVKQWIYNIRIC